jgi:uncharacterized membrane protein
MLGILLAVAASLRLFHLDAGLWFDEIDTLARHVSLPLREIVTTYESQNQHLFYSIAARLVTSTIGESAWALRLPAVIFGVASIWATWWFGKRVTSRREALLAAALLTFSAQHVWFSQNARGYTSLLFFTLVGSGLFLELLRGSITSRLALTLGYAVAMALAVYTHLTALVILAAHAAVWAGLWLRKGENANAPIGWGAASALALAGLLAILLYLPVLPQIVETLSRPGMPTSGIVKWQSPGWFVSEVVGGLARRFPGGVVGSVMGGLVIAGVVGGAVSYARQSRVVVFLLLLPALLTAVVILLLGHNLWPRFFFFSAAFGALMAVRGVFVVSRFLVPRKAAAFGTAVVIVVIGVSAAALPAVWGPKQRYDEAWRFVESVRGPDDAVVTLLMSDLPYRDHPERFSILTDDVDALDCLGHRYRRVWVIRSFPTRVAAAQPRIWERLQLDYREVAEFPGSVRDGDIVVLRSEDGVSSHGAADGQAHPSCD